MIGRQEQAAAALRLTCWHHLESLGCLFEGVALVGCFNGANCGCLKRRAVSLLATTAPGSVEGAISACGLSETRPTNRPVRLRLRLRLTPMDAARSAFGPGAFPATLLRRGQPPFPHTADAGSIPP